MAGSLRCPARRFGVVLAALAVLAAAPATARDLAVVSRVGPFAAALQTVLLLPFAQSTGMAIDALSWSGDFTQLGLHADFDGGWDLVEVDGAAMHAACAQGLLQKLDWNAIGGHDHYLPQGVSDCGVGAYAHSIALSWDREKLHGTPSWTDFWDIAKYPGKRGLRDEARGNFEIALLADGVAPGDVYATLRSEDGVKRAFRKLDQLKPYIVWWKSGEEATRILGSGDVLMSSAPTERVVDADRNEGHSFAVQWAGSLFSVRFWAIVTGSPNLAAANRFLLFAGDPARQAAFMPLLAYGGLAKGANEKLPADLQALSPTAAANLQVALPVDDLFWRDNGAKLRQRFEEWRRRP